jgi:hypothetical protein
LKRLKKAQSQKKAQGQKKAEDMAEDIMAVRLIGTTIMAGMVSILTAVFLMTMINPYQ